MYNSPLYEIIFVRTLLTYETCRGATRAKQTFFNKITVINTTYSLLYVNDIQSNFK